MNYGGGGGENDISRLFINILFVHYSINSNNHYEYMGFFDRGYFGVCFV